jgi:hypothetical protein
MLLFYLSQGLKCNIFSFINQLVINFCDVHLHLHIKAKGEDKDRSKVKVKLGSGTGTGQLQCDFILNQHAKQSTRENAKAKCYEILLM